MVHHGCHGSFAFMVVQKSRYAKPQGDAATAVESKSDLPVKMGVPLSQLVQMMGTLLGHSSSVRCVMAPKVS